MALINRLKYGKLLCIFADRHNRPKCKVSYTTSVMFSQKRCKSKKSRIISTQLDDEDHFVKEMQSLEKDTVPGDHKDITTHVPSMRLDNVLKSAFGIPKSDVEAAFYASNIRLNGRKVFKKSMEIDVGDEIDLVKGVSPASDKFLEIVRAVVISFKIPNSPDGKFQLKLRRFKQLIVENYNDSPFSK